MATRYRERVASGMPRAAALGPFVALGAMLGLVLLIANSGRLPGNTFLVAMGMMYVTIAAGATLHATDRRAISIERALFLVDIGDVNGAADQAIRALRRRVPGEGQARAWLVLGRCAEADGEFVDAADLFASGIAHADPATALARELSARRAFSLAAAGRAEAAASTLGLGSAAAVAFRSAPLADDEPLVARAKAMCWFRRGDRRAVRELADVAAGRVMRELPSRDRTLVRAIFAWAGAPALAAPLDSLDPRSRLWVERAMRRATS